MATDLDISRAARLRPIHDIAGALGVPASAVIPHGRDKAKLDILGDHPRGKLVLVTGITPTPAGEGKTTTTIGLTDGLRRIGVRAACCLREPSLGPCFGMKGGATGGGRAQVAPMVDINLHFTGDFHAIGSAHALLSAMLGNHLHHGNALGLDPRRITWRRAVDMNDRALRRIVTGLGSSAGDGLNGAVREEGFDITVASEVMAILCLATDTADLVSRLGRIVVGGRRDGGLVTARDLKADGAMAALLRDAVMPNLVQTLEGSPALVHGGPFANIAHGCSSVLATRLALSTSDVVVTEAGFGADLGGEKFLDIKCRIAGLTPSAAVLVATARALKMHGGVAKADLAQPNAAAVAAGCANLRRHVENLRGFGLPVVVALNRFTSDTPDEIEAVRKNCPDAPVVLATHWADGAEGAVALAEAVRAMVAGDPPPLRPLYPDAMPLAEKLRTVARRIYRADDILVSPAAARALDRFAAAGFGHLPVCVAKTPYSFSADPTRLGAPDGHIVPIDSVRLSAGAGFVVALAGAVNTMPGLPRVPAAERISLDGSGQVVGLD